MKGAKFPVIFLAPGIILGVAVLLVAVSSPAQNSLKPGFPIVRDWSHRYVVYTNKSFRAATLTQLQRDPRLLAAWVQRNAIGALASANAPARQSWRRSTLKRDWAVSLGNNVLTPGPPEVYPAMWGASFTETSCTDDFVVFPIRASVADSSQANIVAFNNLYDDCLEGPQEPTTMWAYYVGNGPVRTSPVLSLDGTEVAFVENRNQGASAWFHVLKWHRGQGGSPTNAVKPGENSWVRSLRYADSGNRRSSPFVDYWNNIAFVGANDGVLYAIGPVFGRSSDEPLQVLGSVLVNAKRYLTSPVMDPNTNHIFISDGSTLYSYPVTFSSDGSVRFGDGYSLPVATADSEAIQDSALVDIDRQRVFWFARRSESLGGGARVIETDYALTSSNSKSAQIGQASDPVIRAGAFDDEHYTSNGQKGQLHVCGKASDSNQPQLYTFGFSQGSWSLRYTNTIATQPAECSPLTTFKSGDQDRLFLGVSTGEIQMWNLPVSTGDSRDAYAQGYSGGSSGIIIDNRASSSGSNIYFQTVNASSQCAVNGQNRVCAVKLTQAGLQ